MEELRQENAKLKGESADVATPALPVKPMFGKAASPTSPATSGIPKSRGDTRQGYYHTIRSGTRRTGRTLRSIYRRPRDQPVYTMQYTLRGTIRKVSLPSGWKGMCQKNSSLQLRLWLPLSKKSMNPSMRANDGLGVDQCSCSQSASRRTVSIACSYPLVSKTELWLHQSA